MNFLIDDATLKRAIRSAHYRLKAMASRGSSEMEQTILLCSTTAMHVIVEEMASAIERSQPRFDTKEFKRECMKGASGD